MRLLVLLFVLLACATVAVQARAAPQLQRRLEAQLGSLDALLENSLVEAAADLASEQTQTPNSVALGRACSSGGTCRTPSQCPQATNNWVYTICTLGNVCCVPKSAAKSVPVPTPRPAPAAAAAAAGWWSGATRSSTGMTQGRAFPAGGKFRIVLHTVEAPMSTAISRAEATYKSRATAVNPHFTVNFVNGRFSAHQHTPITHASAALKKSNSLKDRTGVLCETNNQYAIQIEIMGRAQEASQFPSAYIEGIGSLLRWIKSQTNVQAVAPSSGFSPYPSSYGNHAGRMTCAQWANFNGVCGHSHVPCNDHGDPGNINIATLLQIMRS